MWKQTFKGVIMIAITGYTGLIGSAITEKFKKEDVLCVGHDWNISEKIDALIHCAGPLETEDPEEMFRRCWNFNELVASAKTCGAKRIIYISTLSNRKDYYTIAHRLCECFSKLHGIPSLVVRLSNVYGLPSKSKNFRWHLIPYAFPLSAFKTQCINVLNASQSINFLRLDGVVDCVVDTLLVTDIYKTRPLTGVVDLTVGTFAALCADIYTQRTGKNCMVVPPMAYKQPYVSSHLVTFLNELYSRFERGYYEEIFSRRF